MEFKICGCFGFDVKMSVCVSSAMGDDDVDAGPIRFIPYILPYSDITSKFTNQSEITTIIIARNQ